MRNPLRLSISTRIREHYILELLKPTTSDVVLDLGCGVGYYCEFLSSFGAKVFGADIDQKSSYAAQQFCPEVVFSICNATQLSFKENSFSKVICSEVLEHIEDDNKVMKQIYRITKPGGLVLITVPCFEGVFGSFIKDIAHKDTQGFEKHFRKGYSFRSIKDLSERNGFRLIRYAYTLTFFTELFMGLTKLMYLLFNRGQFKSQSDLKGFSNSNFLSKLNNLLLWLMLNIGRAEDRLLSRILKGHLLVVLLMK